MSQRKSSGSVRLALALAAGLVLGACSNSTGVEGPGVGEQIADAARALTRGDDGAGQGVTLTDAQINAAPVDILLMEIPAIGSDVGLVRQAINRDVVTWVTPDGYTVALKGGQLVATAGFSSDLSSARIPDIRSGRAQVVRDHYRLQGDENVTLIRYFCTLSRRPETIGVTGRAFATTRIDEVCQTETGARIANVYWIDGRGIVRKSRQYVSPLLGYLELEDVHSGLR